MGISYCGVHSAAASGIGHPAAILTLIYSRDIRPRFSASFCSCLQKICNENLLQPIEMFLLSLKWISRWENKASHAIAAHRYLDAALASARPCTRPSQIKNKSKSWRKKERRMMHNPTQRKGRFQLNETTAKKPSQIAKVKRVANRWFRCVSTRTFFKPRNDKLIMPTSGTLLPSLSARSKNVLTSCLSWKSRNSKANFCYSFFFDVYFVHLKTYVYLGKCRSRWKEVCILMRQAFVRLWILSEHVAKWRRIAKTGRSYLWPLHPNLRPYNSSTDHPAWYSKYTPAFQTKHKGSST